jgi:hypothetical protein
MDTLFVEEIISSLVDEAILAVRCCGSLQIATRVVKNRGDVAMSA